MNIQRPIFLAYLGIGIAVLVEACGGATVVGGNGASTTGGSSTTGGASSTAGAGTGADVPASAMSATAAIVLPSVAGACRRS